MKARRGGECNCLCSGRGGCRAGVPALPAAPPEGAGVARQVWEVETRGAASARSARLPPAAAERLGACPARPGNPRLGPQRRAGRLRGSGREPGRGRRRPGGGARSCGVSPAGWWKPEWETNSGQATDLLGWWFFSFLYLWENALFRGGMCKNGLRRTRTLSTEGVCLCVAGGGLFCSFPSS